MLGYSKYKATSSLQNFCVFFRNLFQFINEFNINTIVYLLIKYSCVWVNCKNFRSSDNNRDSAVEKNFYPDGKDSIIVI